MASVASAFVLETVTSAPCSAPNDMISSGEPATTDWPLNDSTTESSNFCAASAMIRAGRACSPMVDPTATFFLANAGSLQVGRV